TDSSYVLSHVADHSRLLMLTYLDFIRGCENENQLLRAEAFRRVVGYWLKLSRNQRVRALPHWLCASAWLARCDLGSAPEHWEDEWSTLAERTQNRLPEWMREVSN